MKPRPFSRKRTRASRLRLTFPLGLLPSLLVGSCSSSIDPDAEEVVLTIVSGDGQVGVQGTELSQPITVRVPRGREEPFAGIRVEAVPGPGSGQLMDQVVTTDAQGRAHFRWVLGDAWFNTVRVSLPDHGGDGGERKLLRACSPHRPIIPQETDDGWETSSLSSVGLDTETVTILIVQV